MARKENSFLPRLEVPHSNAALFASRRKPGPVRADRDLRKRAGCPGQAQRPHVPRAAPKLDRLVAARGEKISLGMEGQSLNVVELGDSRVLVEPARDEGRIGEPRPELARGDLVNEDLVRSPASGNLPLGAERGGVNGAHALRQGMPLDGSARGSHRALGPLVNPDLDQSKLGWLQGHGAHLVVQGRHERLFTVGSCLEKKAFIALSWNDRGPALSPFEDRFRRLEDQIGLGHARRMAREAVFSQDGEDFLLKVHRAVVLDVGHGNGADLRRLVLGRDALSPDRDGSSGKQENGGAVLMTFH